MRPLPDCTLIAAAELPERAADLRAEAWRLVTASSVRRPGGAFTVLYHFERGDRLVHLRVELPAGRAMPSIGSVYPGAFLVENEMVELHGLPIQGMAIDYGGRLYRDFDRLEGWVHGESDGGRPPSPLAVAARLRLDASVPLRVDGLEVRAPGSRVPDAPAVGEDADAAEASSRQPPDRERDDGAGA